MAHGNRYQHGIGILFKGVGANLGPTHTNAHDCAVSDSTNAAAPMLRAVRPVRGTGQTGSPAKNGEVRRTLAREGPVRAAHVGLF